MTQVHVWDIGKYHIIEQQKLKKLQNNTFIVIVHVSKLSHTTP